VDHEEGQARLFRLDDFGLQESATGGIAAVADEVLEQQPDLILVQPGALALAGDKLVTELNRLARFDAGYAWRPAPGELASA
jgi:hypothetical protein